MRAVSDRVLTKSYVGFQSPSGICDVALADVTSSWPLAVSSSQVLSRVQRVGQASRREQAPAEVALAAGAVFEALLTLSLEIQEPIGGLRLPAVEVALARASCGAGRSLDAQSGRCRVCERGQYVLDPDADPCRECPVGAVCNGSSLTGLVEGSAWVAAGKVVRLVQCPKGYILVRDEAAAGLDQCVICPPGESHEP